MDDFAVSRQASQSVLEVVSKLSRGGYCIQDRQGQACTPVLIAALLVSEPGQLLFKGLVSSSIAGASIDIATTKHADADCHCLATTKLPGNRRMVQLRSCRFAIPFQSGFAGAH